MKVISKICDFFFSIENNGNKKEKIAIKATKVDSKNQPIKKSISKYDNLILCYMVSLCEAVFLSFGAALKKLRCEQLVFNRFKKGIGNGAESDEKLILENKGLYYKLSYKENGESKFLCFTNNAEQIVVDAIVGAFLHTTC